MIFKHPQTNDTCLSDEPLDGWVEIEQDEYLEICASRKVVAQALTPAEKLAALDAENSLTQRNLRDTILLMAEAFKTLSGGALDLTQLPGVAQVAAVEAEAAALRAQL